MIENCKTWQIDKNVRYRRVLDEAVVIHQDQAEALVLNDTAIAFLELCDGNRSFGEIIATMTGTYDVTAGGLERDLQPLIQELAASGIIHRVDTEQT